MTRPDHGTCFSHKPYRNGTPSTAMGTPEKTGLQLLVATKELPSPEPRVPCPESRAPCPALPTPKPAFRIDFGFALWSYIV